MIRVRLGAAVLLAASVAIGGVSLAGVSATESSGGGSGNVASATVSGREAADAAAYWTPARMRSAKSLDVPLAPSASGPVAAAPEAEAGGTVSIAGTTGSLAAPAVTDPEATLVPRPYTNFPDRLNAKVFFVQNGGNFVCSGTIVNSENKDLVSTAGHCVADNVRHRFSTNVIVVPAYASGSAAQNFGPYGNWTARTLTTRTEWISNASPQFKLDLGYIILNVRNGQHVVNLLGGQGSRFNGPRSPVGAFHAFGYPQAAPFNGKSQYRCDGQRQRDDNPGGVGPLAIKINCNMTGGSSGGGWLVSLAANGLGYVNGHNDYKYNNDPNSMYSPYYGNEALSLFNFSRNR